MNQESININQVMRNTRRYWYVDGINEIAAGLLIILIALTYYFSSMIPNMAVRGIMLGFGQPVIIIGGSLLVSKLVKFAKERITYPRSGYLVLRQRKKYKLRRMIIGFSVGLVVSIVVSIFNNAISETYVPVTTATFMAILSFVIGYQFAVPRFFWISALTLAWGVFISWWYPDGVLPFVFLFGGVGVFWLVSGLLTLFRYLRETEIMEETL